MTLTNTRVPDRLQFGPADRMLKALDSSGQGVSEVADRIEVSRNAVSNWIHGRNFPRPRDLRAFAEATGVQVGWIMTGEWDDEGGGMPDFSSAGGAGELRGRKYTPRDLNPEPTDSGLDAAFWAIVAPLIEMVTA